MSASPLSATPLRAPTLAGAVWPQAVPSRAAGLGRSVALVVLGAVLLTLSAKVHVPFFPVPMTLQTLAVPVLAAAYGSRLGPATVLAYIAAGLAGLPVFTNTPPAAAGPLYLLGTTGGYLVGSVLAAVIVGRVAESRAGRSLPVLFAAMLGADALVLALGFLWLAFGAQVGGHTGLGVAAAFMGGVAPFLLGDLVKTALAACLIRAGWTALPGKA